MIKQQLQAPKSLSDITKMFDEAQYIRLYHHTTYGGGRVDRTENFSVFFDDFENDTRMCISGSICSSGFVRLEVRFVHGFDADKNRWSIDGRTIDRCIEHRRGRKAFLAKFDSVFEKWNSYKSKGSRHNFSAHKRDHRYEIY